MNTISRILWRSVSIVAFILLSQFLYARDMDVPVDWSKWLSSFEATCVAFLSFLLLLLYLATVLCLTPNNTK